MHFSGFYIIIHLGYVWFLENTKNRKKKKKKKVKENDFLIFGFPMENTKENQIL